MTEENEYYTAFIIFLIIVYIAYLWLEDHRDRIRELSHTLQLVELHTGIPYYSSLRSSHLGIEDATWLKQAKERQPKG
jgi:hypothetical protein